MRVLVLTMVILLLVSCGKDGQGKERNYKIFEKDGYQTIVNKNKPALGELKLEKKLALELIGPDSIMEELKSYYAINFVNMDDNGNFFILNPRKSKIYKFNQEGKYQLSFGHSGQGPGEFNNCYKLNTKKDTIIVHCTDKEVLIKYSNGGEFISEKKLTNQAGFIHLLGNNYLFESNFLSASNNGYLLNKGLKIVNKNCKEIKEVVAQKSKFDLKVIDPLQELVYAISGENLYVAKTSDKEFQVSKYDSNGNKLLEIKRSYIGVPYSEEEKNEVRHHNINGQMIEARIETNYKRAINNLFTDQYKRLWVSATTMNTVKNDSLNHYEIYDKNGIYQYYFKTKADFRFIKDKLIIGEDNKIKVYDY